MRPEPSGNPSQGRRRLARGLCRVQQCGRAFPLRTALPEPTKKPPECGGFYVVRSASFELQPFGDASSLALAARAAILVKTAVAVAAVIAIGAAFESAMLPTAATAETAAHAGEDRKPALLAVIEGLVERV